MRRVPLALSVTRPASLSTFRCWETAGRLTGNASASSPTARGRSARHSKMARRVGSPRAVSPSVVRFVTTNGKLPLTVAHHDPFELAHNQIDALRWADWVESAWGAVPALLLVR